MTDTLPLWAWMPTAIALWGYLAVDALLRARKSRKDVQRNG